MDQTLKLHEEMIDKHEYKLEDIQQDLLDVKVRLGIKDKTNGQVVEYQRQLENSQRMEREDRERHDTLLLERIEKIDERIWYLAVGIGVSVLLEIGVFIIQSQI